MAISFADAPFFTVLVPVEAEVFPLKGEPYFTWLQPGTRYAAQDAMSESMIAGPLTEVPEMYFICIDHPNDWHRFVFAADPSQLPLVPPTLD